MATAEEILEEARKLIGVETKPVKAKYPVEYEPLRRWCNMAENTNPLFLNPEYAKKTKYGKVICPPGAVQVFTMWARRWPPEEQAEEERLPDIPTPGSLPLAMGNEWEFFKPAKVGEWLSYKYRLADAYLKGIRYDPQALWTVREQIFMNEAEEEVAIFRSWGLRYRSKEELERDGVTGYPK